MGKEDKQRIDGAKQCSAKNPPFFDRFMYHAYGKQQKKIIDEQVYAKQNIHIHRLSHPYSLLAGLMSFLYHYSDPDLYFMSELQGHFVGI